MFGHQDDPLYGIGQNGDSAQPDVKSIVGDYPAVMGFDIGYIELSAEKSLDNVCFARIRQEIISQYKRG
jgi:mannan endo-1,4-beta-mannosidase